MDAIDLSLFTQESGILEGSEWYFVIKSQDQLERRRNLIESREGNKFGRISARPTAVGLLAACQLEAGSVNVKWTREFREPRHLTLHPAGGFLLTEIDRILHLDGDFEVVREIKHPFFAFLHTLEISSDRKRLLVTASGYDSVFEIGLESGDETFSWTAWEHGFNPDEDGVWLALNQESLDLYTSDGKEALLINPDEYGEQGLVTARRSAHPNVAAYDIYDGYQSLIVSIGHHGHIYRVNLATGDATLISDALNQMPHGIKPYQGGWCVTNTTRGEWWIFDKSFVPERRYSVASLGGKPDGLGEVEWVQQVVPVEDDKAMFLDANRGIIVVDFTRQRYSLYEPNENWCFQDAIVM